MEIYKKRRISFIICLLAVLCVTALLIRNSDPERYPGFSGNRNVRVRSVKGTGAVRLISKEKPLGEVPVFSYDDFLSMKLDKGAKVILEFGGNRDIFLMLAGPVNVEPRALAPRFQKSLSLQRSKYNYSKAAFFFFTGYAVFAAIALFLWILFVYFKNMSLVVPYPAVIISSFASFLIIRFGIDLFHIPFLRLTPLHFFLFNLLLIGFSWFLFDKNMFIPGLLKIKSRSTELLLEAEDLFKEKKYKEGLSKLREALKTDPDRYDIVKLIRVLEHRYKEITG